MYLRIPTLLLKLTHRLGKPSRCRRRSLLFFLWIRCPHTPLICFVFLVTLEFFSSALFFQTWQFEGEDLALDDPNIVDLLINSEDFFMEGTLDCKHHSDAGATWFAEVEV